MFLDLLPLKLCGKEGHVQRLDISHINNLPRRINDVDRFKRSTRMNEIPLYHSNEFILQIFGNDDYKSWVKNL